MTFAIRSEVGFVVELPVNAPHARAAVVLTGPSSIIGDFRSWLNQQHGAFGHRILDGFTTPVDLHAAMFSRVGRALWTPEVLEGQELIEPNYSVEIQRGTVT